MKTLAILTLFLASCAVEEETVTTTSKSGLVTTTTRKSSKPVEGVLPFAAEVVKAYSPRRIEDAPRARVVREEKSGRITAEEIANRWKP